MAAFLVYMRARCYQGLWTACPYVSSCGTV